MTRNIEVKNNNNILRSRSKAAYIFLLPWAVLFLIFTLYPLVYGIYVSFTDFTLAGKTFIGLDNYKAIFSDQAFAPSLVANVFYAAVAIPLTIIISLLVANALIRFGKGFNTFTKLAFYLPGVISSTALVLTWKYLVAPQSGYLIWISNTFDIPMASLLENPIASIPIMAVMVAIFNFGQAVILYSAAINSIPVSYYEAANIDGATRHQQFFSITIPMLHQTTLFILVTSTIAIMQLFVVPYLITNGGPQNKSSTVLLMIYKSAFQNGQYGYASAIGILFFILLSIVAFFQFKIMKRDTIEY